MAAPDDLIGVKKSLYAKREPVYPQKIDGRRFSDVLDNAMYWRFIVWSWVILYVTIYWTPRWV